MPARGPLLGPDTISARLLGHPALLLGGPRALLLQVANPGVAAGVAQHSAFTEDPFGRLARTLRSMEAIAFGSPERAAQALRVIGARHRPVQGLTEAGSPYSAGDPDLVLWVHATLVDTALAVDHRYIGLLSSRQREIFYQESKVLADAFRIPAELVPEDLAAFRCYMARSLAALQVGSDARAIARSVLRPAPPLPLGPLGPLLGMATAPWLEAVTADLLPRELRDAYGLQRGAGFAPAAVGLELTALVSRALAPRLPRPVVAPGTLGRIGGAVQTRFSPGRYAS